MADKAKNRIRAKIFFGIAASLFAVSLVLFFSLQIYMPRTYEQYLNLQMVDNLRELADMLELIPQDEWNSLITAFVLDHGTSVRVGMVENFEDNLAHGTSSMSVSIFMYDDTPFHIIAAGESAAIAATQISGIFTQIFPYALVMILVVSLSVSFVASRFVSRMKKLQDDIEKEREHERRRRDFFVAISHELKTPVTVLKGELEGMILNVGKYKDRDKFLPEALKTAESIEKLISEIMTIAKLDTVSLKKENIVLAELVQLCLTAYEPQAQAKDITINCDFAENAEIKAVIKGDTAQIKTVLSNIMGNAINYSPEKSMVNVCVTADEVSIENTGVSIAQQDLEKIYEPFYRVEKSRSRNTGGSGLGLYIVKTILDLHGLEYSFLPTPSGMKFTIKHNVTKM